MYDHTFACQVFIILEWTIRNYNGYLKKKTVLGKKVTKQIINPLLFRRNMHNKDIIIIIIIEIFIQVKPFLC